MFNELKGKFDIVKKQNPFKMIVQIPNLPQTMVGFRADGEVTAQDFEIVKLQVAKLGIGRSEV